ncbi:MAG: hypothetical protein QG608_3080 [Actinomycetota bacterium]|nr:hypothetical protein [Actinomycetota bacterium]
MAPTISAATRSACGPWARAPTSKRPPAQDTPEALVAHDADRLECLIQALEHRHQGYARVQEWIDNCRATLKTSSALAIADAAGQLTCLEWQHGHR